MPMFRHDALTLAVALLAGLTLPALPGCARDGGLSFFAPSPGKVARDAFDTYDADKRRRAITTLSAASFGDRPPYLNLYRTLADDPAPTVRAACAQALGMHDGSGNGPVLIDLLRDDDVFVRWCAAQALQKIHDPASIGPLVQALSGDDNLDVRMACAHALGQYPRPAVFDALVGALSDTNFGVVHAARGSLATLTGHTAGYDGRDWIAWSRDHHGKLFADGQAYTYQPYPDPPGPLTHWFRRWTYSPPPPRTPAAGVAQTPADRG